MNEILKFIGVVLLMMVAEGVCTLYLISTEKRQAVKAGLWCCIYVVFTDIIVINYVGNKTLIIATGIGAFLGTYIITKFKK